jgi:hypothetical protein
MPKRKMKYHHKTLFALVIGSAVIAFWRGLWGLMDIYVIPHNYELSLWATLIAGVLILIGTHYVAREFL